MIRVWILSLLLKLRMTKGARMPQLVILNIVSYLKQIFVIQSKMEFEI